MTAATAVAVTVCALAIGSASAGTSSTSGAGAVATELGSPDPHSAALSGGNYLRYAHAPDTNDSALFETRRASFLSYAQAPDPKDAAWFSPSQIVRTTAPNGFDWGDFGIGIGTAVGLMLIVGSGFRRVRQLQHRLGSV